MAVRGGEAKESGQHREKSRGRETKGRRDTTWKRRRRRRQSPRRRSTEEWRRRSGAELVHQIEEAEEARGEGVGIVIGGCGLAGDIGEGLSEGVEAEKPEGEGDLLDKAKEEMETEGCGCLRRKKEAETMPENDPEVAGELTVVGEGTKYEEGAVEEEIEVGGDLADKEGEEDGSEGKTVAREGDSGKQPRDKTDEEA